MTTPIEQAARDFTDTWGELATMLVAVYGCTMNCAEADTLAALFLATGHPEAAAEVIRDHAAHDEPNEKHWEGSEEDDTPDSWAYRNGKVRGESDAAREDANRGTKQGDYPGPDYIPDNIAAMHSSAIEDWKKGHRAGWDAFWD